MDGVCGLASIIIVVYHFGLFAQYLEGNAYPVEQKLAIIYRYGYLAVELFFIISGFLVEYSYGERLKAFSFFEFMIKRIKRLYPLLFFTVCITGLLQLIFFQLENTFFVHPISLWGAFLYVFGLQNAGFSELTFNGPGWYVGVLVLMYGLYFIASLSYRKVLYYIGFIVIGMCVLCNDLNATILNSAVARGLVCFFCGVLVCILYKNKDIKILRICYLVLLVSSLLIYFYGELIIGNMNLYFGLVYYPSFLLCVLNNKLLTEILSFRPLLLLGDLSYDIFLYHFPIQIVFVIVYRLGIIKGFHLYSLRTLVLWIVSTITIAAISRKFWDKKLDNIFGKFLVDLKLERMD